MAEVVLNLVINGLPSILNVEIEPEPFSSFRFKPCYKWITFNTLKNGLMDILVLEGKKF